MPSFNFESAGEIIRVNFGRDISAGTSFKMTLEPQQNGSAADVAPTLGTSKVVVDDEVYEANQYIEYTILAATFIKKTSGRWRKKGVATLASQTIATDYSFFRVMP